jgi:spore germination protein GerM
MERKFVASKILYIKYYFSKAEFNVFAEIIIELEHGTKQIEKNALIIKGETLGCDTALIKSISRTHTPNKINLDQKQASHVTHTHGANIWTFNQHTNVKVVTPRQQLINANKKRVDILMHGQRV